jgi:hypothetical protein
MSLFSRLFKSKTPAAGGVSYQELIESVGLLLLAAREKRDDSLRHSPRLGELLGLLWQDDPQALKAVHEAFSSVERIDRNFVQALGLRLRAAQPTPPPTPEGRYAAVVHALEEEIRSSPIQPLPFPERVITTEAGTRLVNTLTLARILLPSELHPSVCDLLIATNRACHGRLDDEASTLHQHLIRDNIHRFLASIAPEEMPRFWERVRDPAVSEEFWPSLRRIRDIDAVPFLLDLLPDAQDEQGESPMSMAGQREVIQALREIGDARAVPMLLAIEKRPLPPPVEKQGIQSAWDRALSATWRERSDLTRLAGQAARHIMRNSNATEAQLLRPSASPSSTGETLLRPIRPDVGTAPSGEMMRASEEPKRTNHTE